MATLDDINQRTAADLIRERRMRPPLPETPEEPDLRTQREMDEASKPYFGNPNLGVRGFRPQPTSDRVVPLMAPNEGPPISAMVPKEEREAQTYTRPPYTVPSNRSDDFTAPMPATTAPAVTAPTSAPMPQQFIPSLRDQINEGISRDFEKGIDRGLPFIGGGGGRMVQSMVQSSPIQTDDPRQLRIASFANQIGVDPALALAFAGRESGFNTNAVGPTTRSGDKAVGDMQIMPNTFKMVNERYMGGRGNINNPDDRTMAGLHYLKEQFQRFGGNIRDTALAYFGGPGNVAAFQSGINRTDGAPGRAGTTSSAYAQAIMDRYEQLIGGRAGAPQATTQGVRDIPGTGPQDSGPLRQPIEIIRGLQRTAFDPFAQQEFVSAPPGVSPQIAALMTAVNRGLPAQVASQIVSGQEGLKREELQQRGMSERQTSVNQVNRDNALTQAANQGDALNRVQGRILEEMIAGKTPEEQLKIVSGFARQNKLIPIDLGQEAVPGALGEVKMRNRGQVLFNPETGSVIPVPQQKPDKASVMREAQGVMSRGSVTGPRRDAFIAQLRADGLTDQDLTALGLLKK